MPTIEELEAKATALEEEARAIREQIEDLAIAKRRTRIEELIAIAHNVHITGHYRTPRGQTPQDLAALLTQLLPEGYCIRPSAGYGPDERLEAEGAHVAFCNLRPGDPDFYLYIVPPKSA